MILPDRVKDILVVNQKNHIGDSICSLPFYDELKKKYTRASITLVAAVQPYQMPLSELLPQVDDILYYDKSSISTIFRFYRRLRRKKYQIGIVPSAITQSRTAHIINFLSGAAIRVGVNSIDHRLNPMRYLLNVKGDFAWTANKVHQTDRFLDVVRLIGCDNLTFHHTPARLSVPSKDVAEAQEYLNSVFPEKAAFTIGLHPGAGRTWSIWNVEKFLAVIKKIDQKFDARFIIDYGITDEEIIRRMRTFLVDANIPHRMLMNPFKLVKGILSLLDVYITNNTGPMHIAGAVGTKTIALCRKDEAFEWAPRGDHMYIIESPSDDINDITVELVFEKCRSVLENSRSGRESAG